MKIKGQAVAPPQPLTIEIHRSTGPIEFVCGPVLDFSEFDRLVPRPKPPLVTKRINGEMVSYQDVNSEVYRDKMDNYGELRTTWMILKSLAYTELEWETVDMQDPSTWSNYTNEMGQVLTPIEVQKVQMTAMEANSPSKRDAKGNFTLTLSQAE